ncbi:hypothetical protein BH10ACI4_BH10ACI4_07880 [soil metagenome]
MLENSGRTFHAHCMRIPTRHDHGLGSRTHGVVILRNGLVAVLAQARPALHFFESDGTLVDAWGEDLSGAHGLTHTSEDDEEFLWITDQISGQVSKRTTSGRIVQKIDRPAATEGEYSPTWVAVAPVSRDVWVADGYGSNQVRRYTSAGVPLGTITGLEGPGHFARPHGIGFASDGTALVADRRNHRILRYDRHGNYLAHWDDLTHSPCGFAFRDGNIYIPELFGDLKVFNASFGLIETLATNLAVRPAKGWPDQPGWGWPTLTGWPDMLTENLKSTLIAPHACAISDLGEIYTVEWVLGGRISRIGRDSIV